MNLTKKELVDLLQTIESTTPIYPHSQEIELTTKDLILIIKSVIGLSDALYRFTDPKEEDDVDENYNQLLKALNKYGVR